MKRALILGANGFLGTNLTKHLLEQGVEVCALVQKGRSYSNIFQNRNVKVIEFEFESIFDIIDKVGEDYDVLYHLAWHGVSTTHKNDILIQTQNIQFSINIIDFASFLKVKKLVFPGSASEYGCSNETINGANTPSPTDIYSAVKLSVRYICGIYAKQKNIDIIWASISSVYGPGRDDNNLITYTINSLLLKKTPQFTKLEQKWDYIYISDLAKALYLIGVFGESGKNYPLGYGASQTLREYVEIIRNLIDPNLPVDIGKIPYKNSVIDNQVLDISELFKDTGFVPEFSFEKGIKETIEYYKKRI